MNPHAKKENLLALMRNSDPLQPIILSVRGVISVLTSRQDKQDLVDVISDNDPTYVELFDFPNMEGDKNLRGVKAFLEELMELKPNTDEVKLTRLHLAANELTDDDIQVLAEHVASICAKHETPDITCDTGDNDLNSTWNTIFYGLTSGNGMEDVYGSFMALAGEQAAMRKFDSMRDTYEAAISTAETAKQKAATLYIRGYTYLDCLNVQPGLPVRRLLGLAVQDLEKAHEYWPESKGIKALLGRLYIKRGVYFTNRGGDDLERGLADFQKADGLVQGQSPVITSLIEDTRKAIDELKSLRQSFKHILIATRETIESKGAKKEAPLSRSSGTLYSSSKGKKDSGDDPKGPEPDGPKGPRGAS